jgi:hypothetical protein
MEGDKKLNERRLFDLVYGDRRLIEVRECENPDFLARHGCALPWFGVEVTEYFQSETDARIDRIPGYIASRLTGGNVRHKQDVGPLEVKKADIVRKGRPHLAGIPVTEVIFGDTGVLIDSSGSLNVRLHSDFPISSEAVIANADWESVLGLSFRDSIDEFRRNNTVLSEAAFPVTTNMTTAVIEHAADDPKFGV